MSQYKVCVYAIAKNEEKNIEKWYNSMKEADCIVVADTGSTDQTIDKLRELGVCIYSIYVNPWRLDKARNLTLSLVPNDVDICVYTNFDEVFVPGWRKLLENAWKSDTTRLRMNYTVKKFDNSESVTYLCEKAHARFHFEWICSYHESLIYEGDEPDSCINEAQIHLIQESQDCDTQMYDLNLLDQSVKEFPLYERNIFFLGKEYMQQKDYTKAIDTFEKYLSIPSATWKVERSACMRHIGLCYLQQADIENATSWLFRSVAEGITIREPYLELAKLGFHQKNWLMTYYMVDTALALSLKTETYLDEEEAWGSLIYELGAKACSHLGLHKQSFLYAKEALIYNPDNPRLQELFTISKENYIE